jgi:RNA polymerase sigma factor (sigma-70 family)
MPRLPSLKGVEPLAKEVMLRALQPSHPDCESWQDVIKTGRLDDHRPEEIVAACRRIDRRANEHLVGELLAHLGVLATRFLAPRINPNRPNRGKDALNEVRSRMMIAILDPKAADGLGYETAFYPKLRQRLIDELRRNEKRQQRYEPFGETEEGEELEPPDRTTLNPEEAAIMSEAIQSLPEEKRKAFLLRRAGFEYVSELADVPTIADMLNCSDKTARKWVAEAEKLIRQKLGVKP